MTNTTAETLSVNGTVLNTYAMNIESLTGRLRAPAYRTENVTVPGVHGDLWVPNKKYQSNTLALPMWVLGTDEDGDIPFGSTDRREFFKRVNELVGIFKDPTELLDVQWKQADGSVRQCWAECQDVLDFTTDSTPKGLVGVVLTLPEPFWRDINQTEQAFLGGASPIRATSFVGSTAPIDDMVYEVDGPWNNPGLDYWDGSWWQYNGVVAAGQTLTVDCGEWELTGTGGLVVNYGVMTHDGSDGVWGSLPAQPTAAQAIDLRGTGMTAASSMTLRGYRKFLIG